MERKSARVVSWTRGAGGETKKARFTMNVFEQSPTFCGIQEASCVLGLCADGGHDTSKPEVIRRCLSHLKNYIKPKCRRIGWASVLLVLEEQASVPERHGDGDSVMKMLGYIVHPSVAP